ncbi:MAG: hypothetical protein NTX58_09075 [Actinobacteria bacterium]|nr:hypothetical protein [Actinomycetota bacterium]
MPADTFGPLEKPAVARPLQLELLRLGDTAVAWSAAGFFVSAQATVTLGQTIIQCTGQGEPFQGWQIHGREIQGRDSGSSISEGSSIDGLKLLAASDQGPRLNSVASQPHPNGITSIDHIVVSTGDSQRTVAAFESAGFEVRGSRSTSSYGSPMRQTFFWAGDVIVELMGPDFGEATSESPAQIFGLALVAADLDSTAAALGELLGTLKAAVQTGSQIARLRTNSVGIGLPIAVMSPHLSS